MDVITLSLAKQYANSQRIAYEDKRNIVWNGDLTGRESFHGGVDTLFVRVSDTPIEVTADNLKRLCITLDGAEGDVTGAVMVNHDDATGVNMLTLGEGGIAQVIIVKRDLPAEAFGTAAPKGVYFLLRETGHTSILETETIHPIEPKYLPGVCLPVVELTTFPTEEYSDCNEADNAALNAVEENGLPFIARLNTGDISLFGIALPLGVRGTYVYEASFPGMGAVHWFAEDGMWSVGKGEMPL